MKLIQKSLFVLFFVFKFIFVEGHNHSLRSDWMKGKYGLMVHWLTPYPGPVNKPVITPQPAKGPYLTDLNESVDKFDLKRFMRDFDRSGAEWMIFTIGQGHSTFSSPNSVIDSLCGQGFTSRRDLVLEIAQAVKKRGKRFIAYLPVEIHASTHLHKGFGWVNQPGTDQAVFQNNYFKVIKEWSLRYGTFCDGWWFDGCYGRESNNFNNKHMRWEEWYKACRAGNPNSVLAFNPGVVNEKFIVPIRPEHDYLAGETVVLIDGKIRLNKDNSNPNLWMPTTAYVNGTQCLFHSLLPIDVNWGHSNPWPDWTSIPFKPVYPKKQDEMQLPVYSDTHLQNFVKDFTKVGGAVTLNVGIFQEGHFGSETVKQLKRLKNVLSNR
jgi:hypothetical protein